MYPYNIIFIIIFYYIFYNNASLFVKKITKYAKKTHTKIYSMCVLLK